MNTTKILIFLAAGLLPAVSYADAAKTAPMTVSALMQDPKGSDGKAIEVKGFYLPDLLKVPHLYASREDALADKEFGAIDLIFIDDTLEASIATSEPACLVLKGTFNTYDHGHVLIGLTSKYGLLYVQSVERCAGKQ